MSKRRTSSWVLISLIFDRIMEECSDGLILSAAVLDNQGRHSKQVEMYGIRVPFRTCVEWRRTANWRASSNRGPKDFMAIMAYHDINRLAITITTREMCR